MEDGGVLAKEGFGSLRCFEGKAHVSGRMDDSISFMLHEVDVAELRVGAVQLAGKFLACFT